MPLQQRKEAFNHPDWLFELKYDGFRALAVIQAGHTQLVSRNGHPFTSFADLGAAISADLNIEGKAVLDGEIVCEDHHGRSQLRRATGRVRCGCGAVNHSVPSMSGRRVI
jgi:bifunctional non-homologous end joining protein LigD